jgi:plasmid maintenance system antidote protein VapI
MSVKNLPYPGDFIRTEIIEPVGLTVTTPAVWLRPRALPCPACLMAI